MRAPEASLEDGPVEQETNGAATRAQTDGAEGRIGQKLVVRGRNVGSLRGFAGEGDFIFVIDHNAFQGSVLFHHELLLTISNVVRSTIFDNKISRAADE